MQKSPALVPKGIGRSVNPRGTIRIELIGCYELRVLSVFPIVAARFVKVTRSRAVFGPHRCTQLRAQFLGFDGWACGGMRSCFLDVHPTDRSRSSADLIDANLS